jgi:hypothetical protein
MDVITQIKRAVDEYIFKLCSEISDNYPDIIIEDLLKIWCEQQNVNFEETYGKYLKLANKQKKIISSPNSITTHHIPEDETLQYDNNIISSENLSENMKSLNISTPSNSVSSSSESFKTDKIVCMYVFQKGVKAGTRCTSAAKNSPFCTKHNK